MRYIVHCVSGLQDLVAAQLSREEFGPVALHRVEEGFLLFETARPSARPNALPYVNNCFLVLESLGPEEAPDLPRALERLAGSAGWRESLSAEVLARERSFRVVLSDENRLAAGNRRQLDRLGGAIERLTGLAPRPRGGGVEFWLIRRRSGGVHFCLRLSRGRRTERDLEKGELRPELAHLLALLSEPADGDVFLDPFAGTGAIPLARARLPFQMIFALDRDPERVRAIRRRMREAEGKAVARGGVMIARQGDATRLERIDDGFIDKVVTDPPWGLHDGRTGDLEALYAAALRELCRVTKPGGILILLLSRSGPLESLAEPLAAELSLEARHDLLVAGQKCVVLKWRRAGSGTHAGVSARAGVGARLRPPSPRA